VSPRRLLVAYALVVLVAMTWVTTYATLTQGNVLIGFREVAAMPWGLATLFDAYFGFLAFYLYVLWREESLISKTVWFVLLMLLGNFAIVFYGLGCLLVAKDDEDMGKVFFTRKGTGA
jgi:hypothetical protein